MRPFSLLLLAAAMTASPAPGQSPNPPAGQMTSIPFQATDVNLVVGNLAKALEEKFVFPETGKAYAAMLRSRLSAGAYASFPNAKAFADRVSEDLRSVHADGHLRLHVVQPEGQGAPAAVGPSLPTGSTITKSGWLAPGVAYISFSMFLGNEATLKELREFLDAHKDAKSLIIDARGHRGGGLDEMDLLFAEIYSQPTELVMMDTRRASEEQGGNPLGEPASLKIVPTNEDVVRRVHVAQPDLTPTALRTASIYYLTSRKTASAAEHLALAFKRTHRATLIGEATRGAGHYGGMVPVGSNYAAFIPIGRTFDPDTGEGWEGIGVKPDVNVPADKALDEALRRAGVSLTGEAALAALS